MKQIKFKQLATFSLCCSLLVNSLTGVTAVAETMTIESSPTVESKEQTEDTKETAENEVTETLATETSEAPTVESQEEKETSADVVEKKKQEAIVGDGNSKTAEDTNAGESLVQPKHISPKATVNFPRLTYQFGFIDETGKRVDASTIHLAYDIWAGESFIANDWNTLSIEKGRFAPTNNNLKEITYYKQSLNTVSGRTWQYSAANLTFFPPKYYEKMSVYNKNGTFDTAYLFPNINYYTDVSSNVFTENATKNLSRYFELTKSGNQSFVLNQTTSSAPADVKVPMYLRESVVDPDKGYVGNGTYFMLDKPVYYYLTYRKVTENFVDASGAKITPPTGFTQGKQTVIDSDPYTYTQSGTLPKSYKGTDGKTYVLKGWYKGKTKPDTLSTGTPTYKVTYDDDDDLTVVYEETQTKTYTLPSKDIYFGYVDEQGELINPGIFITEATVAETTETGTTDLSTIRATNVTASKLEKLTIPQKVYTLPENIAYTTYGTRSVTHETARYYKNISISPGDYYTGDKTKYPIANEVRRDIENPSTIVSNTVGTATYNLTKIRDRVYNTRQVSWSWDPLRTPYAMGIYSGVVGKNYNLATPDKTIYYYLENRRVTENFIDSAGNKLPSVPTGFKQGQQTVINSSPFTYTSAKALPDSYKGSDGKTYIFKGWYKGKTKPDTLETTKTPSYKVTFDDNDDLNVVYEERVAQDTWIYPGFYAEFVDEQGKAFEDSLTFSGNYTQYLRKAADATLVTTGAMIPMTGTKTALKNNQYKIGTQERVAMPADFDSQTNAIYDVRGYTISDITIANDLKYVDKIETTNTEIPIALYPAGLVGVEPVFNNGTPTFLNELDKGFKKGTDNKFAIKATFGANSSNTTFPRLLRVGATNVQATRQMALTGFDGTAEYKQTMNYKVTRKQVTEKFVDTNGNPINPPTNYTQNKQTPMTSNSFTFTQAGTLPATYKDGAKTYIFKGWYKGKTKPSTLKTTKTPSYPVTFDGDDDLNVVYEEGTASVAASLKGMVTVMPSGGNQMWNMTIKNTGTAPLTDLKITPTANWSKGLANPKQLSVRLGSGPNQLVSVTAESWANGANLGVEVPVGGTLTVSMTTLATGNPMEVLQAEVALSGNMPTTTVSDTVRIQGSDQEVTDPVGEGFISTPTFDFGTVNISSQTQQHGLKKAADYYGNGTRNPFLRIKKSQPNWSLTAQLSPLKSTKDSLPAATKLLLGKAPVSKVDNYNLPTELMSPLGTTAALSLMSDNSATTVVANNQYTGNNVYHLDFAFNNVKLEVPANQGTKGEQYNATVTWNLVTGP
ncbi:WxL domain-containing protein [Enterococcus faecalis]|uniref:WxL domain-containing protein n=1 Tax=Enterococcus faecalis TaxID=1351 RepID=UPI000E05875A|nr:WxL domain-containing protein [Enterococcus faecalis]MDB1623786.1 WxL domain-containing protein [Enterococcus faecalis]RBR45925.1 hypothetical protein EB28_01446 [Enterococcus faecalis]